MTILNYPENREWKQKTFSMPKLPRGKDGQLGAIRQILQAVQSGESPHRIMIFEESGSRSTLDRLCEWLRPVGLVNKENGVWKLTEEAKACLDDGDGLYVTAVFCSSVIFMGEILYYLQTPLRSSDLLEIAADKYKIKWRTRSEIGNRLSWFREAGLVRFEDYKLEYGLTEKGADFLQRIQIVHPEDLVFEKDPTGSETQLPVSDWALELCRGESVSQPRRMPIGYIPGRTSEALHTIVGYLQLLSQETTVEEIRKYSMSLYGIAVSSSNMFLAFLVNLGFVNRRSRSTYQISQLGSTWLSDATYMNLAACLHSRYLFVFELLAELTKGSKNGKELAAAAKVSYGFERESIDEIRKRLILLGQAGLLREDGTEGYCLTQRGRNLLKEMGVSPVPPKAGADVTAKAEVLPASDQGVEDMILELRLSAKDSADPSCLEKAVKRAFEFLGFRAQWLGGPGRTDVLVQAQTSPKFSYVVAVDGKSTSSGNVTEGMIDFDTLQEHRKIHGADYSAIVGCSFQGERLVKRAKEHKVALIGVDDLERLIRSHREVPLTSEDYRTVFEQSGLVDLGVLDAPRERIRRYGLLADAIMSCLASESADPVTEGILSVRDLYRSLRDDARFAVSPTMEEIEDMLGLLSSPLINCVGKTKDGCYAIGSLQEAGNKFRFYARACLAGLCPAEPGDPSCKNKSV